MPSAHSVLSQRSFITPGGNVGCTVSPSRVRCVVITRVWTAPAQPQTCKGSWGDALVLNHSGLPSFGCGGRTTTPPEAPVVPDGWDDQVGQFTCQVRRFGVDCFNAADRHGLLISRTGYTTY